MKLKKGDLIVFENTDKLSDPIEQFHEKWEMAIATAMAHATAMVTATVTAMATVTETATATGTPMASAIARARAMETATEKQTGKQVKIKYHGLSWKPYENNRLVGIVTEITKEEHRDLDVIKIREQTGGVRYCRRYILENV